MKKVFILAILTAVLLLASCQMWYYDLIDLTQPVTGAVIDPVVQTAKKAKAAVPEPESTPKEPEIPEETAASSEIPAPEPEEEPEEETTAEQPEETTGPSAAAEQPSPSIIPTTEFAIAAEQQPQIIIPATEFAVIPQQPLTEAAEPPPAPDAVRSENVPIFTYHTSAENNPGRLHEYYVKPSEFEKQIKYLTENNYTFCTFNDWYEIGLHDIEKPVFITFDDGYQSNYTEIFPILQKYNAKITIFLAADNVSAEGFTAEMIREMSDSRLVKFESHTVNHVNLADISGNDEGLTSELEDSKHRIEELTGRRVLALAYPGGGFNAKVIERVKEYYLFGVSTIYGFHNTGRHSNFEIRRLEVNRSTSLNAFISMLGG